MKFCPIFTDWSLENYYRVPAAIWFLFAPLIAAVKQ
jgi:hypothetical protein